MTCFCSFPNQVNCNGERSLDPALPGSGERNACHEPTDGRAAAAAQESGRLQKQMQKKKGHIAMKKNCIASTPPMGWNSWNTFYDKISAQLVCSIADTMAAEGYLEAGYRYLIVDDCWSRKERDENGRLVPDPGKFPDGIRPVADYIHAKGLKFGMYADCGVRTCADYPGSFEHEFDDARQFAAWGVDYLKYDNGYRPGTLTTPLLYRRMSLALKNSGRDILLAACQWGTDEVHNWIRSSGAHTFRSTVDITDSWDSIKSIALSQLDHQCCTASHCFNDMMLGSKHGIIHA